MSSYGFKSIQVRWLDSSSLSGWSSQGKEAKSPCMIQSRGFLVREDADSIILTHSVCDPKHFRRPVMDPVTIPKAAVVSRSDRPNRKRRKTGRKR